MNGPVLFLIAASAPILWLGGTFLLAQVGGWAALAREFPDRQPLTERNYTRCSGSVGIARYRGCLHLDADDDGLHMAMLLPFRFAHPPLFIPWTKFHDTTTQRLLHLNTTTTNIGRPTIARLKLPDWVADRIPAAEQPDLAS